MIEIMVTGAPGWQEIESPVELSLADVVEFLGHGKTWPKVIAPRSSHSTAHFYVNPQHVVGIRERA